MPENRTAGIAAQRLKAAGYDVTTRVGQTGVVGLLRNGDGPTVMLRADMDALPVQDATGLPYAKNPTPVSHSDDSKTLLHESGHVQGATETVDPKTGNVHLTIPEGWRRISVRILIGLLGRGLVRVVEESRR